MSISKKRNNQLVHFIRRQFSQIRKGGILVLFVKMCKFPLLILALPLTFFVRILRPLVVFRFGVLPSDRIGHFAVNLELYLCERDVGRHNPKNFDIFYYNASISNSQLKKMWNRTLRIHRFAKFLDKANHLLPGGRDHMILLPSDLDVHGFLNRTETHLSFTPEEESKGAGWFKKLEIPEDNPFVCFHARDSAYLNSVYAGKNWNYHDYRDSNINSYIPAVEELARRGYFAVRMGKIVKEALTLNNPKIIDYALIGRCDFLDIYLAAKCRFFISSGTGIDAIPRIFRRPIAHVNYVPLKNLSMGNLYDLLIPKKLWLQTERRFLSFREILNSKIGNLLNDKHYEEAGIKVVDNTPEEITALIVEMDERLKGTWQMSREDEELQRRFWNLFKLSGANQVFLRIGADFLRQNQELLK